MNNITFNITGNITGNITTPSPTTDDGLHKELAVAKDTKIVMYVMFSLIIVLGVIGNSAVMTSLLGRKQKLKNYDIYIMSLTIADLISSLVVPMVMIHDTATGAIKWYLLGVFGCKVFVPMNHLTMLVSTLMMVLIALSRLMVFYRTTAVARSRKSAVWKVIVVWLIAIAAVSPFSVMLDVHADGCHDIWPIQHGKFIYFAAHQVLTCVIPGISLPIIYGFSIHKLMNMQIPGENSRAFLRRKQQNKALIVMFGSITLCFFVLTTPYMVAFAIIGYYFSFTPEKFFANIELYTSLLETLYTVSAFSAVVNPFIYAYMNKDMKRKMRHRATTLSSLWRRPTTSTTVLGDPAAVKPKTMFDVVKLARQQAQTDAVKETSQVYCNSSLTTSVENISLTEKNLCKEITEQNNNNFIRNNNVDNNNVIVNKNVTENTEGDNIEQKTEKRVMWQETKDIVFSNLLLSDEAVTTADDVVVTAQES